VNHLFKVPELMARQAMIPESEIVVREGAYARR